MAMETTRTTETDVVPATPGVPPQVERRVGAAQVEAEPLWYWCPSCKLASSKAGDCANCGKPYEVTPDGGVPAAPFQPKVAEVRRPLAVVASALGGVLALGALIGGLLLLASHGDTYSPAAGNQSGDSANAAMSTFNVSTLHGTLQLQGAWSKDDRIAAGVRTVATNVAPGAHLTTDVSVLKSGINLGIVSFPDADPTGVLGKFVVMKPQSNTDSQGQQIKVGVSRDLSIAGFTTVAQDFEVHNTKGGLIDRGTIYAVNTGDHVVLIRSIEGPAATQDDLASIEKALLAIG
jgi:hypothetical protein